MTTRILIAIPTAKNIEAETFKSIYDLNIPNGVDMTFQYFFGYSIAQVRNLIADWATNFDYLFAVDSDIVLPNDCLEKMLAHNVDVVSGLYIQRKPNEQNLEIYRDNGRGGQDRVTLSELQPPALYEIVGCGFGCVLIKSSVIRAIGYPQFEYHMESVKAIALSEDVDFCLKARKKGAKIYVDSSIVCPHIGSIKFIPTITPPATPPPKPDVSVVRQSTEDRLLALSQMDLFPVAHTEYLKTMGVHPKVIYDIGASTLHWTNAAKSVWPDAAFVLFDAIPELEFLYRKKHRYHIGVLSDMVGKKVQFFQSVNDPAGSSYYPENPEYSPSAPSIYSPVDTTTNTIDNLIRLKRFPLPDLIKMDVQGAELDVLKGADMALRHCTDLILELQIKDYNQGAPKADEVIAYLKTKGFKLITPLFCKNGEIDGDYHFRKDS